MTIIVSCDTLQAWTSRWCRLESEFEVRAHPSPSYKFTTLISDFFFPGIHDFYFFSLKQYNASHSFKILFFLELPKSTNYRITNCFLC